MRYASREVKRTHDGRRRLRGILQAYSQRSRKLRHQDLVKSDVVTRTHPSREHDRP